ncbi:unnamed protein product [Didymodactylos carnosus]|uniref:Uncharacterized protein n=1 Tax=Didymodactylos carnosus TaxID=1234261 RepID=A0A8S2HN66_9BILA|nr:unnamed protein product [Didymodactylos carnosus]CAF3661842.1 unnamed protein product [Didymodactylos carnosus]
MLIGFRVYEYETDTIAYLQPILKGLRLSRSPLQMRCIPSHNNKREQALERRSTDPIERIKFLIQNVFNVLKVLNGIEDLKFHTIAKETLTRIKENIQILYSKNDDDSNIDDGLLDRPWIAHSSMGYPNNIDLKDLAVVRITTVSKPPKKSMKITLAAVKAAVRIYDDIFYPQALHLFYSEPDNHQKEIGNLEHQHAILQTPFNTFSLSTLTRSGCIFHNHNRDKIDVYGLLADSVEKNFLSYGQYLETLRRLLPSWMIKFTDEDDTNLSNYSKTLINNYGISREKYVKNCEINLDHADGFKLSLDGEERIKIQYEFLRLLNEKLFKIEQLDISMTPQILITDGFTEMEEIVNGVDQSAVSKLNDENNTNGLSINDYTGDINVLVSNFIADHIPSTQRKQNIEGNTINLLQHVLEVVENMDVASQLNCRIRGVLGEKIKDICGKVLMIDSPLLSRTLLNRSISGHDMTDIYKACEVLIKMKLLSLKTNVLANKHSYQPYYLELLPNTVV